MSTCWIKTHAKGYHNLTRAGNRSSIPLEYTSYAWPELIDTSTFAQFPRKSGSAVLILSKRYPFLRSASPGFNIPVCDPCRKERPKASNQIGNLKACAFCPFEGQKKGKKKQEMYSLISKVCLAPNSMATKSTPRLHQADGSVSAT